MSNATNIAEVMAALSDDAIFLLQELPNHTVTAPWGIIPGSTELLEYGCMERDEMIQYGRQIMPLGRTIRLLAA